MSVFKGIKVPEINPSEFNNSKYMRMILDSLTELNESIRYAIEYIDDENITKQFIDDLTVRNLLITNEDNSIAANGNIGLIAKKGDKKQFGFDILTGDAFFGGEIEGGSIQSTNYREDEFGAALSGMRIDLEDGSINAPGFTYDNGAFRMRSKWVSGDATHALAINEDEFLVEYWYMDNLISYSTVQDDGLHATNRSNGNSSSYTNTGIEIKDGADNYVFVVNADNMVYKGWRVTTGEVLNEFEGSIKQWVTDNFAPKV
jgi:hypothetical protein